MTTTKLPIKICLADITVNNIEEVRMKIEHVNIAMELDDAKALHANLGAAIAFIEASRELGRWRPGSV